MGTWSWDVGNVRNELIRGETGCTTFEERERSKGIGEMYVEGGVQRESYVRDW